MASENRLETGGRGRRGGGRAKLYRRGGGSVSFWLPRKAK